MVWSSGKGDGKIVAMSEDGQEHEIVIREVLYVPEVNANLTISVLSSTEKTLLLLQNYKMDCIK